MEQEPIDAAQVDSIDVLVDFDPPRSLIHDRPASALEGKFSIQYCLAAAILDRKVGLDSFTDGQVQRFQAQELIPRITMRRIPGNEGRPSWVEAYNQVEVHLKDGKTLGQRADRIDTGALRGVTIDEIKAKFRDCAAAVISSPVADELLHLLGRLEDLPHLDRATHLLSGASPAPQP